MEAHKLRNSAMYGACAYKAEKSKTFVINIFRYCLRLKIAKDKNYFFLVATAPSGPGPPYYRGLTITHTPHSVGLLWTSDQPDAETYT